MFAFLKGRRFRQGAVATAVTVIVIAVVVVFNILVSMLSERYPLSIDLTKNKLFEVSNETKEYLAELTKDVQIYVLNTENVYANQNQYYAQANEVIRKYAMLSPHITVTYVDLVKDPAFEAKFPNLNLAANKIVVSCGDKAKDIASSDLYNITTNPNTYMSSPSASKAEQVLTSTILEVTSDRKIGVSIIGGHNEISMDTLRSLLELNGYEVTDWEIATIEPDPDSTVAIIAGPARDFTEAELKKLDAYLENSGQRGRTVMYFASFNAPELPNLTAFLAEWGIGVDSGLVLELDSRRQLEADNPFYTIVEYTEDVYSEKVQNQRMYTAMPQSKPLSVLFESKSGKTVSTLLQFSSASCIYPIDAAEGWQPTQEDLKGAIPAFILSQDTTYNGTTPYTSNVTVCGSYVAANEALNDTRCGNAEYFLTVLGKLTNREVSVNIPSKDVEDAMLPINAMQSLVIGLLMAIVLPVALVIYGIVVWMRRRHR